MRIALGLQYDGSGFAGWQSQVHGNTVQDVLEAAITRFTGETLRVVTAGRTDTGVHAIGQVVHFETLADRPQHAWVRGLNAFLPASIAVQWARPMPEPFHARFSAFERTYFYLLYVNPIRSPMLTGRAGWCHARLEVAPMRAAARHLIGEHDFSAFRSSQCQARTPVKHLYAIDLIERGQFMHFRFHGNAFLHHMVRNILGCLITVGRGDQRPDWLNQVMASGERRLAAPTFMADGLYLAKVGYPEHFAVPAPNLASQPWIDVWDK
jgi:tRNA pseudouridine38-40 synthase